MPFPPIPLDKFSSSDCCNIALFSIPPLSAALIGTLALRNENVVKNQYVPAHVPRDFHFHLVMNCLTTAPLGCAAYLVWKNGGLENKSNHFANILTGATLLTGLTMAPAFKLGGFKLLAANTGLLAVLALATTVAFDRVEKGAGSLVLPFAAWAAYCAVNAIMILCSKPPASVDNLKSAKKRSTPNVKDSVYFSLKNQ